MNARLLASLLVGAALAAGCTKVPIVDIEARFDLADAAWFADEETLFYFWEVTAEQGISDKSVVEITYRTDDEVVPWTIVDTLPAVHNHLPVECGFGRVCGSLSLHVPIEPREVDIRLRYHVDGALALTSSVAYNVVGRGPAHTNRSFLVYGVLTENNRRIQWRGRHRFPTLRNEQVTELGLRRAFRIDEHAFGEVDFDTTLNPYGYATGCPGGLVRAGLPTIATEDRAVFDLEDLPLSASPAPVVCARATVHEPREAFVTSALARKNPEVEPAFPVLRSPVKEATPIKFHLAPCRRTISLRHEAMQKQRILYDGPTRCIDDWQNDNFVDDLVREFRDAIEAVRPAGDDMVLVMSLHRDDVGVAQKVERALGLVLPAERDRSTPRVVGGFVFDSDIRDIDDDALKPLLLWCPASVPDDDGVLPTASNVSCAILPDNINLNLGPFSLSALPILPSRSRYLDFIDQYSEGQAGRVKELQFLAPEFTPTTDNSAVGPVVATFFNQEIISAEPDHAFSYCASDGFELFVFRSAISRTEQLRCQDDMPDPEDFCLPDGTDFLPIAILPEWHHFLKETTYELGLVWNFPWLLRATYEVVAAANASAFGLSLPFGFGSEQVNDLGTFIWQSEEFPLGDRLLQCKRFCDHPTFDSAGIYNVRATFRATYRSSCYQPDFPELGDSSFPSDP